MSELKMYRQQIEGVMVKKVPKDKKYPKPWRCLGERETEHAFQYAYEVPSGYSFNDIEKQVDALYAAVGGVVELKDKAGAIEIHVMKNEMPIRIEYVSDDSFIAHFPDGNKEPIYLTETEDGLKLLIGFNIRKEPQYHDFRVLHGLFAGQSQYGKTTFIKWLLKQLISKFSPEDLEIRIVDMKQTSYKEFRNVPHITSICRNLADAAEMLDKTHAEMEERGRLIYEEDKNPEDFKRILIIIDEGAQISPDQQSVKSDKSVANVAWKAAGALACVGSELRLGVWFCTQRPDADSINPQVKANVDMVCCFKTKTESNSRIVLDRAGAEKLPHNTPGRAIFQTTEDLVIQVPFVSKEQWEEVLKPYAGLRRKEEVRPMAPFQDAHNDHESTSESAIQLELFKSADEENEYPFE